ncbi:hypothetical protein FA13DRAFT_1666645 [Coprinellus micaceus]|uniref:MYND-type domain-containing protein n=1 Tax=Coprinellus micaceus TaxID=71717 RepID=A0A4Y7T166_COPMI|nr:hypothetical protein FA13DRAFT_1666645 [Coprinellus micaceus]
MSHPLIWPSKTFFYPIGNTSAVSVTADLPPEEPACVLLLGCGDPRNILHTVATETHSRPLDFTCCDVEPAVLARNVLLFTLIMDGQASATIWNVFYHFRLDAKSHKVLIDQCNKLIDLSENGQQWRDSQYGATLRMATDYTLSELRRHWGLYAAMPELPAHHRNAIDQEFRTQAKKNAGRVGTVTRSLGPLLLQGTDVVASSLTSYWKSGTTFTDGKSLAEATILNPTFVYSLAGETHSVHYATDPLTPFHLASAFAGAKLPTFPQVIKAAKVQFDNWCTSFSTAISKPPLLVVRSIVGDAMAVCHSLRLFAGTGVLRPGIPVAQWKTHLIQFNPWEYVDSPQPAPTCFNVIHTSNLEDHIGLLNVLIPAAPLLSANASSVMYTESLLALASDPTKEFIEHLKADITVMGLLLGICPVDYLCGFASRSNTHELPNAQFGSSKKAKDINIGQFQQIVTWRSPSSCDLIASQIQIPPPSFDPYQMATFFYDVYQSLYAQESALTFWNQNNTRRPGDYLRAVGSSNITAYYTREAFVLFLKSVKDRLQPTDDDWASAVSRFNNRLLDTWSRENMETLHYQDLIGHLRRYGLYRARTFTRSARKVGPFAPWATIPDLIRIVLVVPRHELHVLEGSNADEVGTPPLHCEIFGSNCLNLFTSVHAAFGRAVSVGTKDKPQVVFEEDLKGWKGKSPLVVSFTAPAYLLTELVPPNEVGVAFAVRNTPAACATLIKKLGMSLRIFSAKLLDSTLVHILPEPPLPAKRMQAGAQAGPTTSAFAPSSVRDEIGKADRAVIDFDEDCEHVSTLAIRVNITDETSLKLFSAEGSKAVPDIEQVSACVVKVALGGRVQHVVFPFPVVGSQHRLRLARKSRYIEVLVPPSRSFMEDGMKFNPYPVVRNGSTIFPWSIHRISPSSLPVLNVNSAKDLKKWLGLHIASMMSNRERKLRKKRKHDALMFAKDTIHMIFTYAAGIEDAKKPRRIFQLVDEVKKNSDTIFFVDKLRFDGASHTVVCDGYVFAGTPAWIQSIIGTPLEKSFGQLLTNADVVRVPIFQGEMQGWKQLLPAFAERCRTWSHNANCEYNLEGNTIPLSEEMEEVPLCSCGQGKEVEGMLAVPLWKPFAPYVTRVAISPLFAVSYLESVGRARGGGQGRKCAVCRGKGKGDAGLKTCSGCKKVRYCSDACQKKDWKAHKPKCKA